MEQIHCKVSFRNELRRFPLNGVGFNDLQKIIQNIFGFDKEFTLLYRDNENDYVLMSSHEELVCAISCIRGDVLQIVVQEQNPPTMDIDEKTTLSQFYHRHHHHCGHFRKHHNGRFPPPQHPFNSRGSPFPPHFHRHCRFGKDQSRRFNKECLKKEIISSKIKEIENLLLEFTGVEEGSLTPQQSTKLQNLQKKKRKLEKNLLKMDEWSQHCSGKKSEKCLKKRAKKEKKFMKKMEKHGKLLLDSTFPEIPENSEMAEAYVKFQSLKPELDEIKIQLKASKAALKEAQSRGESTDQWVHEITLLKEAKKTKKQQLIPLSQQIHEMSRLVVR